VLVVVVAYFLIWYVSFGWLWSMALRYVVPAYLSDATLFWLSSYCVHLWAFAIALVLIRVMGGPTWRDWGGLTLRNTKKSLLTFLRFSLIYGGAALVLLPANYLIHPDTCTYGLNLNSSVASVFLIASWFWVGLTEEIFFQGLFHSFLRRYWPEVIYWHGLTVPLAGIWAAGLFTLSHVQFGLMPLCVVQVFPAQLVSVFVLGLHFSAIYFRTGSLLHPILAHAFGDGIIITVLYAVMRFWPQ